MCLHALNGSIKYLKSLKHKREKFLSVEYDFKKTRKKWWFDRCGFSHSAADESSDICSPDGELISMRHSFFFFFCGYSKTVRVMKGDCFPMVFNTPLLLHTCLNSLPPLHGALSINNHLSLISASPLFFLIVTWRRLQVFFCLLILNKRVAAAGADQPIDSFLFSIFGRLMDARQKYCMSDMSDKR